MPKKRNGKVAEKVKRYVKAEISRNIENKHFNFIVNQTPATGANSMGSATGVIFPITAPGSGPGVAQRLGNTIRVKKIRLDLNVNMGAGIPAYCRVLIVQDKQQQGVNPILGDVLDPAVAGINRATAPFNPYLTPSRFTILKDWRFQFDNVEKIQAQRTLIIPGSRVNQVHFQSAGTTDGKGMVYALCFSSASEAGNVPRLLGAGRVDFEDA